MRRGLGWRVVWVAVAGLLAFGHGVAVAQTPGADRLAELRELVLYASYDDAITGARALLERSDPTPAERNATLEVLAVALIANRQRPAAETALGELYSRDPGHTLTDPSASPVVRQMFERARTRATSPVSVRLADVPSGSLPERAAPRFRVRVTSGADAVDTAMLFYRVSGVDAFSQTPLNFDRRAGVLEAQLPLESGAQGYTLEFYLETRAPSGTPLSSSGSVDAPLRIDIPAGRTSADPSGASRSPWWSAGSASGGAGSGGDGGDDGGSSDGLLSQWWFWTAAGLLVVGAAGGGYLVLADDPAPPSGSLGSLDLH